MPELNPFLNDLFYNPDDPASGSDRRTAGYYAHFPKAGGISAYSNFLRGSQGRYYNQYLSQLPQNPNMLFTDFLKGVNPEDEFEALPNSQKGYNQAPMARFIGRQY